jgi:hypothetical protein
MSRFDAFAADAMTPHAAARHAIRAGAAPAQ